MRVRTNYVREKKDQTEKQGEKSVDAQKPNAGKERASSKAWSIDEEMQ